MLLKAVKISADLKNSASGQGNYGNHENQGGNHEKTGLGPKVRLIPGTPNWGRLRTPVAPASFVAPINKPTSKTAELPPA